MPKSSPLIRPVIASIDSLYGPVPVEAVPDPEWVARPGPYSRSHEAGRSVDVTLAKGGTYVDMGTDFDEFSPRAMAFATEGVASSSSRRAPAHIEAQRWIMNPANKGKVIEIVAQQAKLSRDLAGGIYEADTGPNGLAKDAAIDVARFSNVLRFRAEVEGSWGGKAPAPDRYYDVSYYEKALAMVNANTSK